MTAGLGLALPTLAWAVPTTTIFVNPANIVPGIVANTIQADGQGTNWTGGILKIDLTAGSVYNEPRFGSNGNGDLEQSNIWPFVPELEFDSWVGIIGFGAGVGIAGGAGDLGGGAQNIGGTGVDAVSVTWFTTAGGITGKTQIANISLTDDAVGTWTLITQFSFLRLQSSGPVLNGVMIPEPATLAILGFGGLAGFWRARRAR